MIAAAGSNVFADHAYVVRFTHYEIVRSGIA